MIHLDHIAKQFNLGAVTVNAIEDISLEVQAGEFVVVLGPSGSGKTTMLNMISALDTPTDRKSVV